jgi:hypothetical protein
VDFAIARPPYRLQIYSVDDSVVVWSWLWVRGGRSKEENLKAIVGGEAKTAKSMGWLSRGCVCLGNVGIEVDDHELDLDAGSLLDKAVGPFRMLGAEQINDVFNLANR